jgi:hypothetical protein
MELRKDMVKLLVGVGGHSLIFGSRKEEAKEFKRWGLQTLAFGRIFAIRTIRSPSSWRTVSTGS